MSRSRFINVIFVVVALSLALAAAGCGGRSASGRSGLGKLFSADGGSASGAVSGGSQPKSRTATTTSSPVGTTGTQGATGGAQQDDTAVQTNKPNGGTKVKPGQTGMSVRVMFWNDTRAKSLSKTAISYGGSVYRPDVAKESGIGAVGPVPYDRDVTLVVYPDGKGGKAIKVKFKVAKTMIPDSEQDAIHVAVSDSRVRIIGNAVDNFDVSFPRF